MSPQNFKHFRILELLGKGGMGEVYLALDTTLERKVALKFLPRDLLRDPSAQGRLLDEARSASRVAHPNIATVHSIEEDGGIYALCMEYVDGATLKQLIKRGPLTLNQIVRVGADIAAGMQAAHEQGMVHRDIKPANVMISRRGEVKVMDFGLAVRPQRVVNTLGPNTYGTVQYMSPEQAQGQQLGPASDIFSLGSLLYEAITGRPPFNASNDLAILQSIINTQPEALRDLRRDVPPALEQVVRGCLAKMPEQRWASMKDICDELQYVEPTVEAGPRDLISELQSGLSDQNTGVHHRPDNAGRVGRRSSARPADAPSGPRSLDDVRPDLPEGIVVHDVVERPASSSRPVPRVAQSTGSRGSGRASRGGGSQSAPAGMVFGPELKMDEPGSDTPHRLDVKSTQEQWQDRARGQESALRSNLLTREEEIAREAARRARDSRPVRPVAADGGTGRPPRRPEGDLQDLSGPISREIQDLSRLSARRVRTQIKKTSPITLILPAVIALLLVAAAGYGLLARIGAVPPIAEVLGPRVERLFSSQEIPPSDEAAPEASAAVEETAASTPAPAPVEDAVERVERESAAERTANRASSMLGLKVPDVLQQTLATRD